MGENKPKPSMTEAEIDAMMKRVLAKGADFKPGNGEDDEKKKLKQADHLIRQAMHAAVLFRSADGATWADVVVDGHRETWAIRSRGFKRWLMHGYRKQTEIVPGSDAVGRAIDALDAMAAIEGERCEVHIRVAELDGILYLDLCDKDWRAIEIVADVGWRIVDDPPVRFRRLPAMLPLPEPQSGGSIEDLRDFLNVGSDNDFVLSVAWLLAALRPSGPYPTLAYSGEHGSAKSTSAKVMRALVDPNQVPIRRPPSDTRDLFVTAGNSHVLALDNLSDLQPWLSDCLCTLSTDGAFATRSLYTDNEEQLFKAKRPVITNGIANVITRPDLADRAIFLTLPVITDARRRDEAGFLADFEHAQPRIIGALLDAVAHGLKALPTVEPQYLPRMADFARWAMACEGALWKVGTFEAAYADNRKGTVEETLAADLVASTVQSLMADRTEPWEGLVKDLLTVLSNLVGERAAKARPWPKSPEGLSRRLRVAVTFLRKVGIEITWHDHTRRGTPLTIKWLTQPSPPSPPSPTNSTKGFSGDGCGDDRGPEPSRLSQRDGHATSAGTTVMPTVTHKPLKAKAGDGCDAGDGSAGTFQATVPTTPRVGGSTVPAAPRAQVELRPNGHSGDDPWADLDIPSWLRRSAPERIGPPAISAGPDDDLADLQ